MLSSTIRSFSPSLQRRRRPVSTTSRRFKTLSVWLSILTVLNDLHHPAQGGLRRTRTKKRHKPEEIVAKLRQVDVLVSQGQSVADAIRSIGVTEVSYYRWRREFGGLKSDQVKRMKELEAENARLRRAVADLTLDKLILKEAASGNW